MKQPKWLALNLVTAIHDEAIYEFGGLAGVRDLALLESALARPRNLLAHEPKSSLFDLAASLCFGCLKSDAFIDGNKRAALLATRAFLFLNGYVLEATEADEVHTMVAVASDSIGQTELSAWLRRNSTPHRE